VPDRRTIRWYATIGLVDRPAAMRGRTALYNRRHLLQLVAVKRLQAEGRSLASVQEDLLGAGDETLERIARLAPSAGKPAAAHRAVAPSPARFWAAAPAAAGHARATAPPAEPPPAAEPPSHEPPSPDPASPAPASHEMAGTLVPALQLGDGVTLLLGNARTPTPDELAAVQLAAGPLLDLLRRLDLTRGSAS
jgi:hypothetical protein